MKIQVLHTSTPQLQSPPSSSDFASAAFYSVAPRTWNSLPENVRNSLSIESFKTVLKTELFKKSYGIE